MEKQLYGFYSKNILLHDNFVQRVEAVPEPGIFTRIWNWKPKKDYLALQLLREWSIHGMKYIVQPDRHIVERAFWGITVLLSTGIAVYFSYLIVGKYNSSPVIVSFQPSQTSVSEVPFPAVTICNVNHFKKSALKHTLAKIKEAAANNVDPANINDDVMLLKMFNHICSATKSFSAKFNFSLGETTVNLDGNEDIEKYLSATDNTMSVEDTYKPKNMGELNTANQQCHEMVHLCIWEGEEIECADSFLPILTDMGVCCVFNMMPTRVLLNMSDSDPTLNPEEIKRVSAEDLESWKKFNLDGALMYRTDREGKEKFPRRQSKAGQSSGLSILLYPQIEEYFCATHDAYGYRIFAHSPIEIPHVLDFGLAVGPNTEMFINVQAEITVAEEDLRSLTSEQRHCYFLNEKKLANYLHYTSSNCIDECVMERTVIACDCVTFDMYQSTKNKKPYCGNVTCADRIKDEIGMKGTKYFCTGCYPSCNRILYDTHTSSLPIRRDINIWKSSDPEKRKDWSNQNVSIVHVFFGSDSVYTRVRKRLFGFSELFANVGGILGLFIGFSVISVVEPVYYIIRLFKKTDEEDDTDDDE